LSISEEIRETVKDWKNVTIGTIGSHTGKQIASSAKRWGFKTLVVVEKGREDLYTKFNNWLFDFVISVTHFRDILNEEIQSQLREKNVIWIPNRSFTFYVGPEEIRNKFRVPMFGSRDLLPTENRSYERGQYYLLEKAGIPMPMTFSSPEKIDRLVIVKLQQAKNPAERADFYAVSPEDLYKEAGKRLKSGLINEEGLKKARIEEYIIGPKFNANFHSHALKDIFGDFAFLGFGDRIQTPLQGFLDLPAEVQLKLKKLETEIHVRNVEVGHRSNITMRESIQPIVYKSIEKFIRTCEVEYPPGIIGSASLQGAVIESTEAGKKFEFVVFDVSPRVPGDPGIGPTSPEMPILSLRYGVEIKDPLDLTMMEIKKALETNRPSETVT